MKQTASASLGTSASVMNKFDELSISLYPSDARVLSSHISVGIPYSEQHFAVKGIN